jgi:hypothetical protein
MISDQQVRRLRKLVQTDTSQALAASKAGMDEKTARKYLKLGKLPSEAATRHTWKTRKDPFESDWESIREKLSVNPGLEAKTLFEDLQRRNLGRYSDGQLRTLQRYIKRWRALEGPMQEVYFPQEYHPGESSESDFTHMEALGITIAGARFDHMMYHFVLPYSNWEAGSICFSESFESLSDGLQNALWELGGVPYNHQTDRLTAAVNKMTSLEEFTARYSGLLRHYSLHGKKTNANRPNENGDVEQRNYRFKRAVEQALLLRGNRDFEDRRAYTEFLRVLFAQLNSGRKERLSEELKKLQSLPARRLESCKRLRVRVGPSSTIRVNHNTYSVQSRLRGENVDVQLHREHIDVFYASRCVESFPRLRGEGGHRIEYRHIIDWLVRKPGAFENYRYREDLFPTHRFRVAYDELRQETKSYLAILHLAAREGEALVDDALRRLIDSGRRISEELVWNEICAKDPVAVQEVLVAPVDLSVYDLLLESNEVSL